MEKNADIIKTMTNELNQLKAENQVFRKEILRQRKKLAIFSKSRTQQISDNIHPLNPIREMSSELGAILFEQLFNNDPDGVYLTDKNGYIITANPAFIAQLNLPYEQVIGTHITEFLDKPEIFDKAKQKLIKTGYTETRVKQKTAKGNIKTTERKVVLIELPDKNNFMVLVISKDITFRIEKEKEEAETIKKLHSLNHELYTLNQLHEATQTELEESYDALEAAYAQLLESEKNYRMISENTGDYIFRVQIDGISPIITYAGAAVKKLGYTPNELKGTNPLDYMPEEDKHKTLQLVIQYYHQYKAKGKLSFEEDIFLPIRILTKAGELLHLESTLNVSRDQLIIIAKDITDLIQEMKINEMQKQRLLKIEKSYRNIYNSASDIFLVSDSALNIFDANLAIKHVLGYEVNEIKNNSLSKIIELENWQKHFNLPILSSEESASEERPHYLKAITKSGKRLWVSAVFRKTTYNDKQAIFIVLRNVNELKKAQDSLAESEEKFRMLAESGASGIFIYQDHKFVYTNEKVQEITGYKEEELQGKAFWEVVHPDMREEVKEKGIRRLMGEEVKSQYEIKLLTKSGDTKWIDFSAKLIQYKGKLAGIGNVVDISNYKETIKKWKAAKEKAEESDQLKSAFLSNMSHEIRTPMNGILGFSQLLDSDYLEPETRRHYISIIKNSSSQLLRIIDDILDISKLDVGQLSVKKDWHVTDLILSELYDIFSQRIKGSNPDIQLVNASKEKGVKIYTDNIRLKQVLTNLLDNAVKYTKSGTVSFGYEVKNEDVLFFVKDTGCGINKDLQKYIFTRFSRLENDYLKSVRGTGLGLAISQGIVELLGGEIHFESDGKTGTVFYFTHPIKQLQKL
jgi:PAS domain S-box-containing protein